MVPHMHARGVQVGPGGTGVEELCVNGRDGGDVKQGGKGKGQQRVRGSRWQGLWRVHMHTKGRQ